MARQRVYKQVRHAVDKQKHKIVLNYMKDNWDVVLNSSVTIMKELPFFTRFRFAVDIILGKRKNAMRAIRESKPKKDAINALPKPLAPAAPETG
jgi:hypothetical protein